MGGGISNNSYKLEEEEEEEENKKYHTTKQLLLSKRYESNYILGEGGYSTVLHGIDKQTNKNVAIKRINLLEILQENKDNLLQNKVNKINKNNKKEEKEIEIESLNTIFTELNAFKRIGNHDFIVTLHSAFRHNVCCYLVMDCLSGGDLRHFLKINGSLNEESVVYIVGCIGSALHHMHIRGVIHRDVKPENIGLDTLGRPYLTDFGISLISSIDNPIPISESSSGTLPYLSPEVLSPGNFHSHQSDYWSLGVLAYELFFGRRPFSRLCPLQMVQFVSNEYGWIWNELKNKFIENIKLSNNSTCDMNSNNNNTNTNTNILINNNTNTNTTINTTTILTNNMNNHNNNNNNTTNITTKSYFNLNMIDFTQLNRPVDWKPPFPNLSLHLNEDGTAPSSLITCIPSSQSSYSSKVISEEFRNLLNGLLDVRIPYRLGNMSRYHEFNDHQCFIKHDYLLSKLFSIPSPLRNYSIEFHPLSISNSNPNPISNFNLTNINSKSSNIDKHSDMSELTSYLYQLSPETQRKLSQFYYLNSCSRENVNLKLNCRLNQNVNSTTHKTEDSITSRLTGRTIKSHDT